jgi:hypothetical protein
MSIELIAIAVLIVVTSLIEVVYLGAILREIHSRMSADDAALYLQGRKVEELLRAMHVDARA